jgi:hypothetical protein
VHLPLYSGEQNKHNRKIEISGLGVMAHACNPSYVESEDKRITI